MIDVSVCRDQFPSLARQDASGTPLVYLDSPGGSQVPTCVIDAISHYYTHSNSNTHGCFITSNETDQVIAQARQDTAAFLNAPPRSTISFGQNMTTLNFLLSQALEDTFQPGDEIVVTDLDHDSNIAPWLRLARSGMVIRRVPLNSDGHLDMRAFRALIGPRTRLVAMGWASNALGTVNPVATVRQWTRANGSLLLIDAVHWAPHGVINAAILDPDFLLCSAYKFFGPHIGILYARPGLLDTLPTLRVRPQTDSGPERMETGTLNHPALAGVSAAIHFIASLAQESPAGLSERLKRAMETIYTYEHAIGTQLYEGIANLPGVTVYGPGFDDNYRAPTISFTVEGMAAREVASQLSQHGILAWDGDFYAVAAIDALHVRERGGLVRLGLAPYNTRAEVERTVEAISSLGPVR